jgi:glycosyl-4,4'-diaponeurosporenoate acyltransferase
VQAIDLPIGWTIVLDSIAWALLQPLIAYLCLRLPPSAFDAGQWLFRTRKWERGGTVYERLFRVKRWKELLPSGGVVFPGSFSMKRIASRQRECLERWVQETCRAELTHWIALACSGLFFLWNPPALGFAMVVYAVVVNLPCILVQRYNRPHFMTALAKRGTWPTGRDASGT